MDVKKLNALRQYSGSVEFECEPNADLISIPMAEIVGNIKVSGSYEIFDDDSVEIKGKAHYLLRGACTRCLKETEREMEADWAPVFVKSSPKDEEYLYENGKISLTESVYDAITFNMPYTFLCKDDCEGIAYSSEDEEK